MVIGVTSASEALRGPLLLALPWAIAAAVFPLLVVLSRRFLWPRIKGKLGEANINSWIRKGLEPAVYHLIPDVTLPSGAATTQIDHVIVSSYGIFVIETKTYKGWIFGSATDAQWTQVNYRRKDRFQNPLRQNFKHTQTLAELTGIPPELFKSMVVFAGDARFKTEMPANVVQIRDFIRYIRGFETPIIKDEQVPDVVATIKEWAGTVSPELKSQHVANLRKSKAPVSASGAAPQCPRCSEVMVLRTSRKGGQFWGCPKYPACRGIRDAAT
jgi:predicted RNA-binding Zn-ribbon protein involved in translation (DUF1610 family)